MQCRCMVLKKCTHAKEEECLQVKVWTNLIVNATIQVLSPPSGSENYTITVCLCYRLCSVVTDFLLL